ncbi:unnamed protein product [Fusarium graminearum]|nr:unnamed protein product [Fusarium graminearum]
MSSYANQVNISIADTVKLAITYKRLVDEVLFSISSCIDVNRYTYRNWDLVGHLTDGDLLADVGNVS